jgi:hypothetical protein
MALAAPAQAYRLPPIRMTAEESAVPAEESKARVDAQLASIQSAVPRAALSDGVRDRHRHLSPVAREALASYPSVREELAFWKLVVDLKRDLLSLFRGAPPAAAPLEADAIAKTVIQTIYDLSQEYRIAGSALIQNFLINRGIKKKGFCYHYVDALRRALAERAWRSFDLRWGEAWAGTFRENNALVITAAGAPFETGLAVDAWRTAGKPFWTPVEGDRFPWKEAFHVVIENP